MVTRRTRTTSYHPLPDGRVGVWGGRMHGLHEHGMSTPGARVASGALAPEGGETVPWRASLSGETVPRVCQGVFRDSVRQRKILDQQKDREAVGSCRQQVRIKKVFRQLAVATTESAGANRLPNPTAGCGFYLIAVLCSKGTPEGFDESGTLVAFTNLTPGRCQPRTTPDRTRPNRLGSQPLHGTRVLAELSARTHNPVSGHSHDRSTKRRAALAFARRRSRSSGGCEERGNRSILRPQKFHSPGVTPDRVAITSRRRRGHE